MCFEVVKEKGLKMKRIVVIMALVMASLSMVKADDRPVTFDQLPKAAKKFINTNFPDDKVSFATVDDDLIGPDYEVVLASGVMLQFENNGSLEQIKVRNGNIPAGIVPMQIIQIAAQYYPEARIIEFDVDRKSYEVKLSNGMEMEFTRTFQLIEIDD